MALCRERILSRLGHQKSKAYNKQKRFIGLVLEECLRTPWQARLKQHRFQTKEDEIESYRLRSEDLLARLQKFEAIHDPKLDDVATLVHQIARYLAKVPLQSVLECLSTQDINPSTTGRAVDCLSKISRYRESATFLCQQAWRFHMLRRAVVEQVRLPEAAFESMSRQPFTGTIISAMDRLSRGREKPLGVETLPPWVQKGIQSSLAGHFTNEVKRRLRESKIHAEIQIVAYYEDLSQSVLRPRVIASCKDACYLCNAFISIHGKFSVPKSHGKLYPGWRLPAIRSLGPSQQRLNEFLEDNILATIEELSQTGKRPLTKFLNESTVFSLHILGSSLLSHPNNSSFDLPSQACSMAPVSNIATKVLQGDVNATVPNTSLTQVRQQQSHIASCSETGNTEGKWSGVEPGKVIEDLDEAGGVYSQVLHETNMRPQNDIDITSVCAAEPQETCSALSGPTEDSSTWFRYKDMEVFVESSQKFIPKWLDPTDSADVLRKNAEVVVDVLALEAGTDTLVLPNGPEGDLYFAFGGQVVMFDTGTFLRPP